MIPDDIAAELPAPRDDEPESLRQDIVDELADHLQCALHRELLAGSTQQASGRREPDDSCFGHNIEQTAWQQVLTRFGSPSAIARQLWFDAMKERIMAQKLTATMATLAAVACVVMCMLLWRTSLTQSHLQSRLEEQRALNASLMADLKSMLEDSSQAATNAGWAQVRVHLQSEAGQPVAGRVGIQGTAINAGNDNEINVYRTANTEGVADFGLLPFGNYEMQVTATDLAEEHRQSFMLSPNAPAEQTIVCPTEPPPAVDVSFAIDVPPSLHADRLVFMAMFERSSRRTSSGSWNLSSRSDRSYSVLFDAQGTILGEMSAPSSLSTERSRNLPGGYFADAPSGFGRGSSSGVDVIQTQLLPARTIRSTDRCVGLQVAASVPHEDGDGSTLRLAIAPVAYTAEVVQSESFPDTDPEEERMRIEFNLPPSIWDEVVAAFRRSVEVADVTIPEGWQVVKVPMDPRNLFHASADLSRGERGRSSSRALPEAVRLQVTVTPGAQESTLRVGVGELFQASSVSMSAVRDRRTIEIQLLVPGALAEAIELARELGVLDATRVPDEGLQDIDENGVNQKSLKTLRKLAAEQPAVKDE